MSDEEAIRRTIAQYCHFCDDGRFEEWAALFTEDATFTVLGSTQQGRAALRDWIAAAMPADRRGKHLCANSVIEVDGDTARAWTDYVFYDRTRTATSAGRYHDILVRDGEAWRIADRRIVFMGEST